MRRIVFAVLLALTVIGCSEQQLPIMTVDQQKTYNNCMEGHWSGAADTFFWGPFGWAFYDSLQHDCLAVAGSLGQASTAQAAAAPATTAGGVQPVSTSTTQAVPSAKPSSAGSPH
jgi:hypothetical protein